MKKYLLAILLVSMFGTLLAACGETPAASESVTMEVNEETAPVLSAAPAVETVDVDLTLLSGTMIVAEMNNIMTKPDEYLGKTFKMRGPYYVSYYDVTDQFYHMVYFEDAQACCVQAMEFEWTGEHRFPDDYPDPETRIEIAGVFGSYEELGTTYYYLTVEDITILE
jgi:hypothetical protein